MFGLGAILTRFMTVRFFQMFSHPLISIIFLFKDGLFVFMAYFHRGTTTNVLFGLRDDKHRTHKSFLKRNKLDLGLDENSDASRVLYEYVVEELNVTYEGFD